MHLSPGPHLLTVLPWFRLGKVTPQDLARSLIWFPWVGGLLGLTFAGAGMALVRGFPPPVAAALLLTLPVLLTRGLHLDGLADTADGLGGGRTPAERLAVMKDSRLGAFGGAALVLALLLKFSLLLALLELSRWPFLVLFPVLSRWGMVFLAFLSPYARPEGGLGQAMTQGAGPGILICATAGALAWALTLGGWLGGMLLAAAGLGAALMSVWFQKKLGGITGDVLGAANEILEILVLAGAVASPFAARLFPFTFF